MKNENHANADIWNPRVTGPCVPDVPHTHSKPLWTKLHVGMIPFHKHDPLTPEVLSWLPYSCTNTSLSSRLYVHTGAWHPISSPFWFPVYCISTVTVAGPTRMSHTIQKTAVVVLPWWWAALTGPTDVAWRRHAAMKRSNLSVDLFSPSLQSLKMCFFLSVVPVFGEVYYILICRLCAAYWV